ncbi:MAG: YicC/YloC family endoribonuclease [Bacteroidia bacterium]
MVYSMTGFGAATNENEQVKVEVEIKSLNSKFLDLNIRLPKLAQPFEMDFRNLINQKVKRGKVQVMFTVFAKNADLAKRTINKDLFNAYKADLDDLADSGGLNKSDLLNILVNLPDVVESADNDGDEAIKPIFMQTMNEAIVKMAEFRKQEGDNLKSELIGYCNQIGSLLIKINANTEARIERMRKRLVELQEKYLSAEQKDSNRYEQEVIFYIERFDITEEIVRLQGHMKYFLEVLNGEGSGKKLGFIAQEMGREINTIGSKANDEQIQHLVVQMKDNLEKIKEQVLNIL